MKPEAAKATSGSVTTLPNGLTVVTEDACTTSTVTLSFPKAGSANEMLDEQGAALINKNLAFKSGSGMSTLLINRTIENNGGVPMVSADRYKATLGYSIVPEKAVGLIPMLAIDCSMEKWDIRDAKATSAIEVEEANASAQMVLTESLFAAAYGPQTPGGRPFYYADQSFDVIKGFRERTYGLNGAILTATGVKDHAAFCNAAADLLSDAPAGSADTSTSMSYLGGETRIAAPSAGYAHVALAFEGPSSSVLAGVVKQLFTLSGLEVGVSGFSTPGLVGVYAGSADASSLVDSMTSVVTATTAPELVKRAKTLAKAEALSALDGGSQALAEFMAASVMDTGNFSGPADVAKAYDAVTDAQVQDVVSKMLKSNPSLAAVGDIGSVPYQASVASRFS